METLVNFIDEETDQRVAVPIRVAKLLLSRELVITVGENDGYGRRPGSYVVSSRLDHNFNTRYEAIRRKSD